MAYGVFNLSWVSAGVAGPLLAGFIAQYVYLQVPFLFAALVSVLGMFVSFLLKGNNAGKKETPEESSSKVERNSFDQRAVLKRVILIFSVTNILNGLLNGFVNPLLNGMLIFKLGAAPAMYGLVLSLSSSLVTGLVQLPGGKLADRFGRKPLTLFGFLGVPLILLLGFSRSLLDFSLIFSGISAVGNISSPAISAWLMDLIPKQRRASVSGITQTLNGIGLTVGPNMGSYAWNATKPDAVIPCAISAVIFVASLPFYLMLKEPKRTPHDLEQKPVSADD
jgi:MFS family permease